MHESPIRGSGNEEKQNFLTHYGEQLGRIFPVASHLQSCGQVHNVNNIIELTGAISCSRIQRILAVLARI